MNFSFVADAVETSDDTATFSLTLKAGEQRIIPQIVSWLRQRGVAGIGPAGSAYRRSPVRHSVRGGHERDCDRSSDGISGRREEGSSACSTTRCPMALASTESAWIYGLQQNAENRSNLALVNTGEIDDSTSTFEITIYDGSGESQPRTKRVTLGPRPVEAGKWDSRGCPSRVRSE